MESGFMERKVAVCREEPWFRDDILTPHGDVIAYQDSRIDALGALNGGSTSSKYVIVPGFNLGQIPRKDKHNGKYRIYASTCVPESCKRGVKKSLTRCGYRGRVVFWD